MKNRSWFFSTPATNSGTRFNTNNKPTRSTFFEMLASIPFFLEPDSEGTATKQGLFKLATNPNVIARNSGVAAVIPSQLPELKLYTNEDDSEEDSAYGIGITKVISGNRENLHLKFRGDTLVSTYSETANGSFVVLLVPGETESKNKSKIMLLTDFLDLFVAPLAGGYTESQINAFIDAKIALLDPIVADVDASVSPPIIARFGDGGITVAYSYTGPAVFIPKLNGSVVSVTNTNQVALTISAGITATGSLTGTVYKVTVTEITSGFGTIGILFTDPISGKLFETTLHVYAITTTVADGGTPTPDPVYTLTSSAASLEVTVDGSSIPTPAGAYYVDVRVKDQYETFQTITPANISISSPNGTVSKSQVNSSTVRLTYTYLSDADTLVIDSVIHSVTPINVAITRVVQPAIVYTLELVPVSTVGAPFEVVVDSNGFPYAETLFEVILKANGVATLLPYANVTISVSGSVTKGVIQDTSPVTSSLIEIIRLSSSTANLTINTNLPGVSVADVKIWLLQTISAPPPV